MINKLLDDSIKILSVKYNSKDFHFEIECIMPGHTNPTICPFDKSFFPKHSPVSFLDEQVQVGEAVQVWIKEEEVLKSEVYLGGAHKGLICLNEKFQPFVIIKGYRFSEKEIKCILRLDNLFTRKNAEIATSRGRWNYLADKGLLACPYGTFNNEDITGLIDVFKKANLI